MPSLTANLPDHHRLHRFPAPTRRIVIRRSEQEFEEFAAAAQYSGLTPTGYCAQTAVDVRTQITE
jgi:hypothetical protein